MYCAELLSRELQLCSALQKFPLFLFHSHFHAKHIRASFFLRIFPNLTSLSPKTTVKKWLTYFSLKYFEIVCQLEKVKPFNLCQVATSRCVPEHLLMFLGGHFSVVYVPKLRVFFMNCIGFRGATLTHIMMKYCFQCYHIV